MIVAGQLKQYRVYACSSTADVNYAHYLNALRCLAVHSSELNGVRIALITAELLHMEDEITKFLEGLTYR
jgi:hypothetical protein